MREVFSQAPPGEKEGALALGGTKWGVIKSVVLPFGRGGIIGGSMLGLGPRARRDDRGHADHLAAASIPHRSRTCCRPAATRSPSLIALRFAESNEFGISALMAAGLTLFVITLIVNALASIVVARSRSGAATEI